ncbi:hypothetical protein KIH27_12675 [Mycobacterium sp. M1]|uniref:Secreted protein n=1 Tax=Mycolicibacter acidiphilus TaxID=2835306 RepID=A0ABS5RJK6_9MYCO|nr:hypothetical protein [Mycolicibacter acidiphilus]MBS9534440.1 hypothetical protein [Mycolicibacter acidiphilus]
MKLTLLAAAAALAGTATVGLSTTGDTPEAGFSGRYAYLAAGGSDAGFATTWTVTGCGADCVHITTASGLTDTDAHREGDTWVFTRYDSAGIRCDNAKVLPATIRFTIDPASLHGRLEPEGTPCGGVSRASGFTLTKLA